MKLLLAFLFAGVVFSSPDAVAKAHAAALPALALHISCCPRYIVCFAKSGLACASNTKPRTRFLQHKNHANLMKIRRPSETGLR